MVKSKKIPNWARIILLLILIVGINFLILPLYADLAFHSLDIIGAIHSKFEIQSIDMAVAILAILTSTLIFIGLAFSRLKSEKNKYSMSNLFMYIAIILFIADIIYINVFSLNLNYTWSNKLLFFSLLFLFVSVFKKFKLRK